LYQRLTELQPRISEHWSNLGNCLCELGQERDALAPLQRALDCGGRSAELHYALARAWVAHGEPRRALDHLQPALAEYPHDPEFQLLRARALVMIDEYEYDLPFYLRPEKDVWVVSDWQDTAAIAARDNWRKELYDAGQFDSAKMREVLLLPGEFVARLCAYTGASLWLWGKTAQAQRYSFLPAEAIAFANARRTVWRLDAEQRRRLKDCQPTPPAG
ncbi:MAG: tetratricopeptide repeat protein, partial [Candidatus Accumulibacter sp.]|uniref:tetratricopeptide repeat protein n=1 Tax=Accumulibacter sp. TaxID=2053492 RepID=UPI001B1AF805